MRSPTELTSEFRRSGLKVTPQRQLLFRLLHGNVTHPTAEALYETASDLMPGISLRTVYQTLNDLCTMGELRSVSLPGSPTRFDPNVGEHHHAVCEGCGEVRDVYVDSLDLDRVHGYEGFVATSASIVFGGRCEVCSA